MCCSSELPFFPGGQEAWRFVAERRFGRVLEVRSQFLHSSDLDPGKPINWKRVAAWNGEYGCLGDLGMHALHLPLRAGWAPRNVRAILSDVVAERPGPGGEPVPCDTWDNAVLLCEAEDAGHSFPLRIETKRIAPGETNTWTIEIDGTEGSIAYTTKLPKTLRRMEYVPGGPQEWRVTDLGSRSAYPTITGRDLRDRLLRRRPADVGGLLRRARARTRRDAAAVPLRDARGGGGHPPAVHGGTALARRVCDGCPVTETYGYRFSFGPWNIHEGADPFGPPVRPARALDDKLGLYKELGFDYVQLHDDDAVPDLDDLSSGEIARAAQALRRRLSDAGLAAEFVAPRLWEHPLTVDGAFTSNDPNARAYALERAKTAAAIAGELGTDLIVLWLAREGTYLREAKDATRATHRLVEAIDAILACDPNVRVAVEPKPNEPMDVAYVPTMGHALALAAQTSAPERVGALMETAHAQLAGLDPADELAFALALDRLWSVHLNDQNGLKYDQDRTFGSVNLRTAFNQVCVLDESRYWERGVVGFDAKALRTQPAEIATKHLRNSRRVFLRLVELSRTLDRQAVAALIAARDYEELDWLILSHLTGAAAD